MSSMTYYVTAAHAASWEPQLGSGDFDDDTAIWRRWPIRVVR